MTVGIHEVPEYERMGQKYKALHDNGSSIVVIAAAHGTTQLSVSQAIHFAETGERPVFKAGRRTGGLKGKTPKYVQVADYVDRLRREGKSYRQIIDWLKEHQGMSVSTGVINRAIDFKNPDEVRRAMKAGETPKPRQVNTWRLPETTRRRIRRMLKQGVSGTEIARVVGCSTSTVSNIRRRIESWRTVKRDLERRFKQAAEKVGLDFERQVVPQMSSTAYPLDTPDWVCLAQAGCQQDWLDRIIWKNLVQKANWES